MPQNQISKEEFSQMVRDFLSRSPKHEMIFARGCRVSLFTVRRWAVGESAPHPIGRPAVTQFIEEHLRSCICER